MGITELRQNLRLLFYLFFSPSRWNQYILSSDLNLNPDFNLLQLISSAPNLKAYKCFYLPIVLLRSSIVIIITSLILYSLGISYYPIIFAVSLALGISLFGGITGDLLISVAAGSIGSVMCGSIAGIGYGIVGHEGFRGIFAGSEGELFVLIISVLVGICSTSSFALKIWLHGAGDKRIKNQLGIISTGVTSALILLSIILYTCYLLAGKMLENPWFGIYIQCSISIGISFIFSMQSKRHLKVFVLSTLVVSCLTMSAAFAGYYLLSVRDSDSFLWNVSYGLSIGIGDGILICAMYGIVYYFANYIAGLLAAVIAASFGVAGALFTYCTLMNEYPKAEAFATIVIAGLIGFFFNKVKAILLHPLYSIYNLVILKISEHFQTTKFTRYNAAFIDEYCLHPQVALYEQTILTADIDYSKAIDNADRLYGTQHHQTVINALREVELRKYEKCVTAVDIANIDTRNHYVHLRNDRFLSFLRDLSNDVEILLKQNNAFSVRIYIQEFSNRLLTFISKNAGKTVQDKRHIKLATRWNNILTKYSELIEFERTINEEVINPYIVATPLPSGHNVFVGRSDIARTIERLVLSEIHCPLLLFGPRRIGKTSLLQNLRNMLPSNIVPLFIDLQGPAANAKNNHSFLYRLASSTTLTAKRGFDIDFPKATREDYQLDPFNVFDEWLDGVEEALVRENKIGLFTLDEFEALHNNFLTGEKLDPSEILGMLRHTIQHRKSIKILLASSYSAETFSRWSNYLVNIRPVKVSYLSEDEAIELISNPIHDYSLKYTDGALSRITYLTNAHPALIQLLCSVIVDRINTMDSKPNEVTEDFIDSVLTQNMLDVNMFFFDDIEKSQTDETGLNILLYIASLKSNKVCSETDIRNIVAGDINPSLANLLDRDILEQYDYGYRFQVPLVQHWFRNRALFTNK